MDAATSPTASPMQMPLVPDGACRQVLRLADVVGGRAAAETSWEAASPPAASARDAALAAGRLLELPPGLPLPRRAEQGKVILEESDRESTCASGSDDPLDASFESSDNSTSPSDFQQEGPDGVRNADGSLLSIPPGLPLPPETPSHGSTLHRTGDCRPCGWFWKPGGCQYGENCSYCHLCSQTELKARKKSKHARMRLGLLTPKRSSQPTTPPPSAEVYALRLADAL